MKILDSFSCSLLVGLLGILFLLNSCQSDEPNNSVDTESKYSTYEESTRSSLDVLTPDQIDILHRLAAINDSVASLSKENAEMIPYSTTQQGHLSYEGMTFLQVVGMYDAKGFLSGWKKWMG
ncbi:MAG: hypothetical protein K2M56_01445 [Muribaculaceae bacterium]|nr:hypothetical protein [Muribaculaceae bacterium]